MAYKTSTMKESYMHMWLMILAGTFLLTSCTQELPEVDERGNGQLSLRLVVSAPAAATTRASEAALTALEKRIDMLEVLFFADDVCVWHPEEVTFDAATGNVSIPLPDNSSLMDGTTSYTVWVVANKALQDMTGSSLSTLKNMVVSDDFQHNGMAPPSPLVMEGSVATTLSYFSQYLGTVALQRVFAKISIRIKTGNNITMNGGYPQVSLRQYKTEAALISTGIQPENLSLKSDGFIAADSFTADQWYTTDYPFYVCPYRWTEDLSKETYIVIKIPQIWLSIVPYYYYYKVKFNYRKVVANSSGMEKNYGIERNHFYDLEVFIDQKGKLVESQLSVTDTAPSATEPPTTSMAASVPISTVTITDSDQRAGK